MAQTRTPARTKQAATDTWPQRRLFTVDEYDGMIRAGILREGERVELVEGAILCMAAMGTGHMACISRAQERFAAALPRHAAIRVQGPLRLPPNWEPEPDLAIVRRRADHYASHHPGPADVLLVIEVADTSLAFDRDVKQPRYAAAGIPEAWIVDLAAARVLVYRRPGANGYAETFAVERGASLSPAAFPNLAIRVEEILG